MSYNCKAILSVQRTDGGGMQEGKKDKVQLALAHVRREGGWMDGTESVWIAVAITSSSRRTKKKGTPIRSKTPSVFSQDTISGLAFVEEKRA